MYILPTALRSQLREPLGKIVTDNELIRELKTTEKCIVVGDESALTLYKNNYNIKLAIVDFHTQRRKEQAFFRQEVRKIGEKVLCVTNPAGTITDDLWSSIEKGLSELKSVRIEVDGEEDLAFIPCMLLAPDNAVVVYGYPGRGLVLAWVNSTNRRLAKNALKSMLKED